MDWGSGFPADTIDSKTEAFEVSSESLKREGYSVSAVENQIFNGQPACYAQNSVNNCNPSAASNDTVLTSPSTRDVERFTGLNEEELRDKTLPDHLKEGLDIVIVGINPSLASAYVGHHYAGPGNHFWTCLFLAGLAPMQVNCYDDEKMLDYGIGFTNVCTRPTKGAAELTRKEMKIGAGIMLEKMRKYRPRIAVFNGKGIYEAYVGHKNFSMGKQPAPLSGTDTIIFVMPSSSARCAQLPRAEDKLPFFIALRKLRDFLRGDLTELADSEVVFADYTEFRVTQPDPKSLRKAERRRKRKAEAAAAAAAAAMASTSGGEINGSVMPTTSEQQQQQQQQQQLVVDPNTGLLAATATDSNGLDGCSASKLAKSVTSSSNPGSDSTPEAQFQQQLQQQFQQQQQQQQAFFFQQQQLQQQFIQPSNQQHALAQHQHQVIVSGGQLLSAAPIPVHPGTQAAMAAGCYATPQFQFSTAAAAPQQFFISPQPPGAATAGGQAFLQWSTAAAGAANGTTAVHFQQPQTQTQQSVTATSWPAIPTSGTLCHGQPPSQQQQQQQSQQVGTSAATPVVSSGVSINGQHQPQFLATQQQQAAAVQVAQQPQQLFFSPQHAMGLQAAATTGYPQQIYVAQTPNGTSYHLLPVGCAASNFTGLLFSEQQQQQLQQQAHFAQCTVAANGQLQRTAQPGLQLPATQQQPSQQQQQQQQQFQTQQQQIQTQQLAQTPQHQHQAYIQSQQAGAMLPAELAAQAAGAQFITLAPGAPVKVMAVGPNGQLIQTTGLPQFMPTAPVGMNIAQQHQNPTQTHTLASATQQHAPTPQQQQQQQTPQQNGKPMSNSTTPPAAYLNGQTSISISGVQTSSNGEDLMSVPGNSGLLGTGEDKLVYTAL